MITRLAAAISPLRAARRNATVRRVRSAVSDGPTIVRPSFGRVTVLAPHPDDETIGCGGTLAMLNDGGCQVDVVAITPGDALIAPGLSPAEVGMQRRRELADACEQLGPGVTSRAWSYRDARIGAAVDALATDIGVLLEETRPDAVFAPWPGDAHADHRAVATALMRVPGHERLEVWGYEVWAPLPANRVVDVSPYAASKARALRAHKAAYIDFDAGAFLGLSRWRAVQTRDGHGFAEGFLVMPLGRLREAFA